MSFKGSGMDSSGVQDVGVSEPSRIERPHKTVGSFIYGP